MDDKWVIVDFDTLDLSENAMILSCSLFKIEPHLDPIMNLANFDKLVGTALFLRPAFEEQKGRAVNKLVYQKFSGENVGNILDKNNRDSLETCKRKILAYLNAFEPTHIFCRGFHDKKWWSQLVTLCGFDADPLPFFKWREIITMLDIVSGNTEMVQKPEKYPTNSLTNVVREAIGIKQAF